MQLPAQATHIVLPGYCQGDLAPLQAVASGRTIEMGPRDLRALPHYFGRQPAPTNYGNHTIAIIAEINHCPRLKLPEIVRYADELRAAGADVIDLGCEPAQRWSDVGDAVRALVAEGHRVSIDSFDMVEVTAAAAAGAELVLSVNSSNRQAAVDWGIEVVAVPDDPHTLAGLDDTVEWLASRAVPLRIDPILEPIGFGFGASLVRYAECRRRYPDAAMMMGVGNLTELTDVDSAGVNLMLLALCQEWQIESVLTTQVINWARTSVQECAIARALVFHSIQQKVLPKHLDTRLLVARDAKVMAADAVELDQLAESIRDNNYRIFASDNEVHLVGKQLHLHHRDPFVVMQQLLQSGPGGSCPKNLDASHAFYLGFEMHKALTATTLGKQYVQDESLDWGYLTQREARHYLKHRASDQDHLA
jgi:dihydropteroate synthase-like protein